MDLRGIFDITKTGLTSQTARMATSANNLSNAEVVTGNPDAVYRPQYPIFTAVPVPSNLLATNQLIPNQLSNNQNLPGVQVNGVYESTADPVMRYEPNNPMADQNGYVYAPNFSSAEAIADMISAYRTYEMNVEIFGTTKQLFKTILQYMA